MASEYPGPVLGVRKGVSAATAELEPDEEDEDDETETCDEATLDIFGNVGI